MVRQVGEAGVTVPAVGPADDRAWLRLAFRLGARARGRTAPNPAVGAVVVAGGRAVGRGWTAPPPGPHAEVRALAEAGERARGATLYVTLEPCSHRGRTPPCTDAILAAGIARVVAPVADPNPQVAGRGFARLRAAGLAVDVGLEAERARREHEAFFTWVTAGRPFVCLKAAMSLDGRVATAAGESRWISGEASRRHVHALRDEYDAVMVGSGTVLADDPALTCRLGRRAGRPARDPARVVVDSRGRVAATARFLDPERPAPVLVATTGASPGEWRRRLAAAGARVLVGPGDPAGRVDLRWLLGELAGLGITSVLVEGGPTLNGALVAAGLADKVMVFVAPKLVGGTGAPGLLAGEGAVEMADARPVRDARLRKLGTDWLIEGYL